MSALDAFLNPVYTETTKDVVVGDRFVDPETGKPVPFKLRTLRQSERSAIRKRCVVTMDAAGQKYNEIDNDLFLARCIVEACVSPDLRSAELSKKYGPLAPDDVLKEMLLAAEYERLARSFMELNIPDEADSGEVTKN